VGMTIRCICWINGGIAAMASLRAGDHAYSSSFRGGIGLCCLFLRIGHCKRSIERVLLVGRLLGSTEMERWRTNGRPGSRQCCTSMSTPSFPHGSISSLTPPSPSAHPAPSSSVLPQESSHLSSAAASPAYSLSLRSMRWIPNSVFAAAPLSASLCLRM